MELRQLEYFCKVGLFENFTRAAQFLHVSQPSVTKAIKSLEQELQLKLIDRSQKRISLTIGGQLFFEHAKKIMKDVEEAKNAMENFKIRHNNIIRFGLPPMVESYLFPNFFLKYQSSHSTVYLDILECNDSGEIQQKLENNYLDFGIIYTSINAKRNRSIKLLNDEFYLCLPKSHRLAKNKVITFADLKDENFILQQTGTYQHQKTLELCTKSGYSPKVLLCTSQLKTIKQLVINEAGISFLPNFVVRQDRDFCYKRISPPMTFNVALAWSGSHSSIDNEISLDFIDCVKSSFSL